MGGIISAVLILVFVSAQSSLFNIVTLDGAVPDIALVFIVLLSLRQPKYQTYFLALWAGLLQDILFYPAIGISVAAKLLVSFLIINYGKPFFKGNIYYALLMLFFSVFVHETTKYVFLLMFNYLDNTIMWYMQFKLAPLLIYNLLILLILYKPINKFLLNQNFYEI